MKHLSNDELNDIILRKNDKPPVGHILYLFPNNCSDLVVASDSRGVLINKGEEWIDVGFATGFSIVPLDFVIKNAYFI